MFNLLTAAPSLGCGVCDRRFVKVFRAAKEKDRPPRGPAAEVYRIELS